MDTHPGEPTMAQGPLDSVRDDLLSDPSDAGRVQEAAEVLREIARSAYEAARNDLSQLAELMANLLSIATSLDAESAAEESAALVDFVREGLPVLQDSLDDADGGSDAIQHLMQEALRPLGRLSGAGGRAGRPHGPGLGCGPLPTENAEEEVTSPAPEQIGAILDSLAAIPADPGPPPEAAAACADPRGVRAVRRAVARDGDGLLDDQLVVDPEIREAYLDDAQRCLASIEASLLAFENDSANRQPLHQVCRELHTLKGASASVGMSRLAQFLHQVEDDLQRTCEQPGGVEIEPILQCVDVVRRQMQGCGSDSPGPPSSSAAAQRTFRPRPGCIRRRTAIRPGLRSRQGRSARSPDGHVGRTGDAAQSP